MKNSTKFLSFNCAEMDYLPDSNLCKSSNFSNKNEANCMPNVLNRTKMWMVFLIFFLFSTSVQTFSQNLLSNNGFDSGTTGWSASPAGSIFTFSGQYAYSGNSLTLNNNDYWGNYYTWQTISATAGIKYDISFMASTHNPVYYAAVGYEFYNSLGLIIGSRVEKRVTGSVYNSSGYSKYEFLGVTAPAGTAKLRVVGYTNGTALKIDNISVSLTSTCSNVTSGGTIGSNQTGCSGFDPVAFTSVTAPSGGAGTLEIIWMKSTTSSVLNTTTQSQWAIIPGATGLTYDAGPITQTTYFTRCSRRAGCTAYVGEANVITATVNANCQGKDPVCLSRKSSVLSSSLCSDATKSYGLWFNDLKGNVACPSQYFTVKSGELTEFCDGTAVLNIVGCVTGGGSSDCITATVNYSGRTGTPPAGSPLSNTHCTGYAPNVGDWYYYPTSNGTFSGTGIFAGLAGTYTQNMAAFQVGTGGSLNDISKFGASSWFKINITNGGTNHWTTASKDGDININLGTATNIASVTATANPSSICKGSNVVLTATLDAASKSANCTPTYSWVGSNGFTSTQATVTNTSVQAATTYTVTVTFTAKNGSKCSVTGTTAVALSANCCDNVTNGGQIGGNQRNCGAFDPAPFTNVTLPSGGTGTLEYLWLRSTTASTYTAANASEWIPIVGSNSATLDLTNISQTTYFQRCSRRAGCTDYVGETNVVSVIIDPLPTAPTVTAGSVCGTGTVTLGATCGTGTTAMWYSALTGGTSIATGASFTTPSLSGTTTYYVSCKSSAGCESGRTSVVASVTTKITDGGKIQADETICTGSTPSKITNVSLPNGGVGSLEYLWLQTTSLTNGVCPANIAGQTLYSPIANTNTSEYQPGAITTTTCYIRCSRLTGCIDYTGESNVIKKTVGSIGVAPTVTAGTVCGTGTVTLGATCGTGTTAMWYSALTGGTSIATGASFTTPSLSGTTTYYVSCKSSAGCESGRTSVVASVTPKITDGGKIQADETICTGSTPSKITSVSLPNGGVGSLEYLWLQTTSLTNGVCPANIAGQTLYSPIANTNTSEYQPGSITTTTCYIRCSRLSGCTDYTGESNVIKKTVGSIGVAPTVTAGTVCGTGTVTLGATCGTGTTAMWYSALTGGTSIATGASFTTPSLSATTTYYVSCKSSAGCESGRTSVVASVNGGATAPSVTPASICGTGTVTLGATCSTGSTAMWYSASTGGTSIASGATYTTPSLTATTTYYVSCKSSAGCESARTSVVATVNGSLSGPSAIKNGTICGNGTVELGAVCTTGTPMWYATVTGGTSFTTGSVYVTPVLTATTSYYVSCKSTAGCESARIEVKATVIAKITNGGTIQADESICLGKTPAQITSVTPASGGDATAAIEYVWLQTTSLSNGACPLNIVGQNLYTEIPNTNTPNYQPGAITQTTCYIRCSRRAGCTDYIGGESNTVKKTVLTNCQGKDPVCLSRKTTVLNSTLCGDATQSYGLYFADLKGNVASPNQHFTVKSGELTEFCDGTAVLNYTACVTGGTSSDCINVVVNYSGRTGTPPTGSPVANTHCTGYSPSLGDWYYYPTSNGTFTGSGIYAGLTGTYTQNMAAFQLGTGASLNDITKSGASSWFKINITNGGTNNWSTVSKDGDINVTLGTPTTIASVTATANPTAICTGGDVNLTATLDANSKSINCTPTYSWVGSNGFTSTQATVTNTNVTASTTYTVTVTFTAANGSKCSVMATTGVTINPTPVTPTVASGSICGTGTVTLGATCSTGATAMWYSASTGGTSIASGASFTTPSLSASTTYYVSCKSAAGCESVRTSVTATVNGSASAPIVTPATTCGAGSVTLGATCSAGTVTWYSASTGGAAIATGASYTTPSLTATTTYYVSCKAGTGCESARTAVVATVIAKITNGGTIQADETLCGSGIPTQITSVTPASGGDVNAAIEYVWLQTTTLSNGACPLNIVGQNLYTEIPNTNTPNYQPGAITQTTCYIRCSRRAGCTDYIGGESNTVKKTVGSAPAAPTVASGSICGTGTVTLGATCSTGATAMWYSASTGGISIASGASFITPSLTASATYYVSCKSTASCESARTAVTATVNGSASAPIVTPATTCGAGSVTLGATCSAGVATWYSALTGGNSIATGASYTTPSLTATTTYYVSCKAGTGCESARTSVTATVVSKITDGGKIQADETICTGGTPSKITSVSLPNGGVGAIEYLWLQTTSLTNGVCPLNIVGQTLYSPIPNTNTPDYQPGAITQTTCFIRCSRLTGCTDYTGESNVVKKSIEATPAAPTVASGSICGTGTVTLGATCSTGATAMWYSASTGGTSIASGASFTTPSLSASTTYYVSCKSAAGCESARTAVTATVNGSASAPTVTPATTCGAGSVTLGATCSAGVATWYSALTGGTAIATGTSYITPSLTATTTYYVSCKAGTGCESARTAVLATVIAKITNGGTIQADETLCGGGIPTKMTSVTPASGGDVNAAIEYLWLQTTTLSNGACPLNIVGQNLYTAIPNSNTADYHAGAITQTTCYIRCSRRAGCTDYIGGESNTVKKTVTTPFTVTPSTNANAVCAGTTVSITLSTTAIGTVSYSWTGPNGFTANTKDVVIANSTVANSGVYTVSVSNGTGCTAVATANVKIANCLKLGDSVFNDKNNNGKQDADEVGISGVGVKLYDSANNLVGTATTDANGKYLFPNLAPGDYVVEIVAPTGYKSSTGTVGSATGPTEPAVDPDNNVDGDDNGTTLSGQTIRTKPVTLTVTGGDNLTVDFGLFKPAQIGDYVFRDSNGDGKQDAGEGGVSGVTVKLYDSANNIIATTTTDANGKYVFDNLIAGNYTVEFVKSTIGSGFSFSPKGVTTSDKDSDADLTTGKTTTITLTEGQVNKDIDAGVTTPCDTDKIPPVLSACPADIIIKTRGTSATISWTEPTATDNCGTVVLTSTSPSGSQFPVGTTTVMYTATDAKGNKATCSFVVNVVKMITCDVDTQAPVFYDCPTDISVVTTGTSAVVLWDHPAVGDNCGIPNITYNFEPGMSFPVGVTTVTYKAVDAKGNTSYCSFKVTVTKKITTSTLTNATARVAVTEDVTFADNVTIYPNPSSSDCSIELSAELMRANKSVEVSILSTAGNVEFSQTATGTERTSVKVPVENMPSGTYFVNVGLENGRMIIKKLQIVK